MKPHVEKWVWWAVLHPGNSIAKQRWNRDEARRFRDAIGFGRVGRVEVRVIEHKKGKR